ncbi:unnamed protein product, partial [Porites lobata]
CQFRCPDGYFTDDELHESKAYLGCLHNGTWDFQVPNCVDRQPPRMSCPLSKIRGVTTKGKATGKVSWSIKVTDNSEIVDPNAKITVDSSHQPSQEFPIGETLVRIIATDSAGNVGRECIFKVEIRVMCSSGTDFEDTPPLLYYCAGGEWNYWKGLLPRYKNSNPWPNCSFNAGPSEIKKLNWMYYYSYNGDAHDANVQNNIKENFFKLLKDPFFIPPPFCLVNNQCTKDKISISAGVVGTLSSCPAMVSNQKLLKDETR